MAERSALLFDIGQDLEDFKLNLGEEFEVAKISGYEGYQEFLDAVEAQKRRLDNVLDVSSGELGSDIEAKVGRSQ